MNPTPFGRHDGRRPAVGAVGAMVAVTALLWHLYTAEPSVFGSVVLIAAAVVTVELLYFDRRAIIEDLQEFEERI